jgi:hypothetical protein
MPPSASTGFARPARKSCRHSGQTLKTFQPVTVQRPTAQTRAAIRASVCFCSPPQKLNSAAAAFWGDVSSVLPLPKAAKESITRRSGARKRPITEQKITEDSSARASQPLTKGNRVHDQRGESKPVSRLRFASSLYCVGTYLGPWRPA